ncbi:hypothetical protein Aduo_012492 [Ancylostoma duodenale]
MLAVPLIVLFCVFSQLHARVVVGDANYYYKVLRLANTGASHSIASRTPSLDRNCFFSPVQCMLPASGPIQAI